MSEELEGYEPIEEYESEAEELEDDGYEEDQSEIPPDEGEGEEPLEEAEQGEEDGAEDDDDGIPFEFEDASGNLVTKSLTYDELSDLVANNGKGTIPPQVSEFVNMASPIVEKHANSEFLRFYDYYSNQGYSDAAIIEHIVNTRINAMPNNSQNQSEDYEEEELDPTQRTVRELQAKIQAIESEKQQQTASIRQTQINNQNEMLFSQALQNHNIDTKTLTSADQTNLGDIIKGLYPNIDPTVSLSEKQWNVIVREFVATKVIKPVSQVRSQAKEKLRQFNAPRIIGSAPKTNTQPLTQRKTDGVTQKEKNANWLNM